MVEYAKRKSDGQEVKIGTCESMYYLRYEDRDKVEALPHSLDPSKELNLFWRLPFPGEDHIRIGEYRDYKRGERLFKMVKDARGESYCEDFTSPELVGTQNGIIQMRHEESGLLLNVRCHHGEKLPEAGKDVTPFWNGKGYSYELAHLKNTPDGVLPIVHCRHCGNMWRFAWEDVIPYLSGEMLERLKKYAEPVAA